MSAATPDTAAAVHFLHLLRPDGPLAITAISPDKKSITTRAFGPDTVEELHAFLAEHNGQRNLYYALNPPARLMNKKAEKGDIARVEFLHVDIDARAGEPLADEMARIGALARGLPPEGVPSPTFIVMTGGGYQLVWRLAEPLPAGGDAEAAEEAERYNRELARVYGADNCHNIDRVLRLPGTTNLPDAKKAKRGRVPVVAELTGHDRGRVYPISRFKQSAAVVPHGGGEPGAGAPPAGGAGRAIAAAPARVADLSELDRWPLPDRVRLIIQDGPEASREIYGPFAGDDSRSAYVFYVAREMVRAGVPDEAILGVLTDSRWPVSAHVLDQGRGAERCAGKFLADAREKAGGENPLSDLNRRHAVLEMEGGKARVLSWDRSELDHNRELPVLQSFEDFRNRYMNRQVKVGENQQGHPMMKPLGDWWLRQPERRQYLGLRFMPGRPLEVDGYLNLWRGFSVEPLPGDWSLMERHIREVLAAGDEASAEYILNWSAWAVQHPDEPAEAAVTFRGGRGAGKGMYARSLKRIFGQHGLQVTSPMQLTGRFNSHLRDCCLLFADEAIAPGDKASESVLKGLITEPELNIEGKGVNVVQARNRLHIIMASNEAWVVPAGIDERRFAVFDVSDQRVGDHAYFKALDEQMKSGGTAAMLHALLHRPLGDWHPRRDIPDTAALKEQKDMSLPPAQMVVHNMLREGEVPCAFGKDTRAGAVFVPTRLLLRETRLRETDERALGVALRVLAGEGAGSVRVYLGEGRDQRQHRGFWLPPLELCRQRWERHLGCAVAWPNDVASWAIEAQERFDDTPF